MKRILVLVCMVSSFIAGGPISLARRPLPADQIAEPSASVFKLYVWRDGDNEVSTEGTAFTIHSTGSSQNPTLYLLTAAHVILGLNADDNSTLDSVDRVEVRFGSGQEAIWKINKDEVKNSIKIPARWSSTGKDFALLKISAAGSRYAPLCLANGVSEIGRAFSAIGYIKGSATSLQVPGKVLTRPGDGFSKPWILADSPVNPGMSGGPVLSTEGVIALVVGPHGEEKRLMDLVPLSLAEVFLSEHIPDWKSDQASDQECVGRVQKWETKLIQNLGQGKTCTWNRGWTDIQWFGVEGWLTSAEWGGGGGSVGSGILLHTTDGGASWIEIEKDNFASGKGTFTWGPNGNRLYSWNDVGPLSSIYLYRRPLGQGEFRKELWLTSATGVYFSDDGGQKWARLTPPPDSAERYALFMGLAGVEGNAEIYTFGWQGIAHSSGLSRRWDLQKPAYDYLITAVAVIGGSENRSVWAVGRAGIDEEGNTGSRSHGAVYHLKWPENKWEQVPLPGISFRPAQGLTDIVLPDYETVFAVGEDGLMIRGSKENARWSWSRVKIPTKAHLNSIGYGNGKIWVVGNDGVILESKDGGVTWDLTVIRDQKGNTPSFGRVRSFGDAVWILGNEIVLKSR